MAGPRGGPRTSSSTGDRDEHCHKTTAEKIAVSHAGTSKQHTPGRAAEHLSFDHIFFLRQSVELNKYSTRMKTHTLQVNEQERIHSKWRGHWKSPLALMSTLKAAISQNVFPLDVMLLILDLTFNLQREHFSDLDVVLIHRSVLPCVRSIMPQLHRSLVGLINVVTSNTNKPVCGCNT